MENVYPNFFIVGAPKAGTTSLYHYLDAHPQIFLSSLKETNYFSGHELKKQKLYYKDKIIDNADEYFKLFKEAKNKKAVGEASVSYLFYEKVPERIFAFNPDAKIIIMLRNPVERAFSHYLMDHRLGLIRLSFPEVFNKNTNHKNQDLYYQQYIELSYYHKQIKRYYDVFQKRQIKVILLEDLKKNSQRIIADLYEFLEVDNTFTLQETQEHNVFMTPKNKVLNSFYQNKMIRKTVKWILPSGLQNSIFDNFFSKNKKHTLDENLQNSLIKLFKEDIKKLEKLLDVDLAEWYNAKTKTYNENNINY